MFNPIREVFKNIVKEKGMFFSSLISLTIVFVLLDMFVFGIFNINDFKSNILFQLGAQSFIFLIFIIFTNSITI